MKTYEDGLIEAANVVAEYEKEIEEITPDQYLVLVALRKARTRINKLVEDIEPGMVIAKVTCPCCGASLSVEHGEDEGEIAVIGSGGVVPQEPKKI